MTCFFSLFFNIFLKKINLKITEGVKAFLSAISDNSLFFTLKHAD